MTFCRAEGLDAWEEDRWVTRKRKVTEAMSKKNVVLTIKPGDELETPVLEIPWQNSPALLRKQLQLREKVLELAGLPSEAEWGRIIAVSNRQKLPSIRRRSQPSELEHLAANLIAYLALAKPSDWPRVVNRLLARYGWAVVVTGRPTMTRKDLQDNVRGPEIEALMAKLRKGFDLKVRIKARGGHRSDPGQMRKKLQDLGYAATEIANILKSRTLLDAACRQEQTQTAVRVSLKTIRNSYSRYRREKSAKLASLHN